MLRRPPGKYKHTKCAHNKHGQLALFSFTIVSGEATGECGVRPPTSPDHSAFDNTTGTDSIIFGCSEMHKITDFNVKFRNFSWAIPPDPRSVGAIQHLSRDPRSPLPRQDPSNPNCKTPGLPSATSGLLCTYEKVIKSPASVFLLLIRIFVI